LRSPALSAACAGGVAGGCGGAIGRAPSAAAARADASASIVTDLAARAVVAGLFSFLSINLIANFLETGHVTGLLLLTSESLVVVLTLLRRRTGLVDRSAAGVVMTAMSMTGPYMVRAGSVAPLLSDSVTASVSMLGLLLVIVGKVSLGRSFGIAPANRGVVMSGPYLLVRHPIYAGYLVTHVAFLVSQPGTWNIAVLGLADAALVARALIEERVLRADADYQSYCQRVGWHFVPGVF
jgi:protein-S-isoprenylcysteine O-methyltransferase Ste14